MLHLTRFDGGMTNICMLYSMSHYEVRGKKSGIHELVKKKLDSTRLLFSIKAGESETSRAALRREPSIQPSKPLHQVLPYLHRVLSITMFPETLPTTMKTLLQPDPASKAVILTTSPLPVPTPNSTEHLIRVHTVALTNGELLWMKNFPAPPSLSKGKEPVPCYDMAGVVVTAPSDSPFQPGSEVFARTDYYHTGSGREYTIVKTPELAFKPKTLSFTEAATVPMSVETAYQALFVHASLQLVAGTGAKGKRVFVTAGSGAVGMV